MKPPSVLLMDAASRPASVYTPAARGVVDRFDFSTLASVRPTIALLHTTRCPQTTVRPLPLLRHWLSSRRRRTSVRPCGTPCRTVRRNEKRAISSLYRATPSVTSEHFPGLLGSQANPSVFVTSCVRFQLRPLPSTGVTRLLRYYGPPRHPLRPGLALTSIRLIQLRSPQGLPVLRLVPVCIHAIANTPAGLVRPIRSYSLTNVGLPSFLGGSAPALPVSGPAQRLLTLRPACSPSRRRDPLHQRLQRLRCLHHCSDCYRAERSSSRVGLAPTVDQRLSRRTRNAG